MFLNGLLFFFLLHSLVLFFSVRWSFKGIKDGKKKDKGTFTFKFDFRGLRLFCGENIFLN